MGHHRPDLADSRHRFWTVYSYVMPIAGKRRPYRSSPSCTGRGGWRGSFSSGFSNLPAARADVPTECSIVEHSERRWHSEFKACSGKVELRL